MSGPNEEKPSSITRSLTDGTGVSKLLGSKIVKDLVLDFVLSVGPAFIALGVTNLEQALAIPTAVGIAVADAGIRVIFRAIVRWAQSPSLG